MMKTICEIGFIQGGFMQKVVSVALILFLAGSLPGCVQFNGEGAGAGALIGDAGGTFLDGRNTWQGGVLGAAIGGISGATLTDISIRASRESVASGKPVEYRTEDDKGVYRADPLGYDEKTKCYKVHERVWEDGKLVGDQTREICEGEKLEKAY